MQAGGRGSGDTQVRGQHPSGRPVRKVVVKRAVSYWRCPLESHATPRLRPVATKPVTADAIGYLRADWIGEYEPHSIGFVRFR